MAGGWLLLKDTSQGSSEKPSFVRPLDANPRIPSGTLVLPIHGAHMVESKKLAVGVYCVYSLAHT